MAKVPEEHQFLDVSDYARPFANLLARSLKDTPVTPVHVTWLFILVGLIAAYFYTLNQYETTIIAGLLLVLKSGLDAADGSLAREKNRPSKVGRFLVAVGDFFIDVFVVFAIAWTLDTSTTSKLLLGLIALASITWQVSIYNYLYVLYRWHYQGDLTSKTDESQLDAENYPYDNQTLFKILHLMFRIIYLWQDKWIAAIDRAIAGPDARIPGKTYMTSVTVMGLGIQLLIICLFSLINKPVWALYVISGPMNLYWLLLFILRRPKSG